MIDRANRAINTPCYCSEKTAHKDKKNTFEKKHLEAGRRNHLYRPDPKKKTDLEHPLLLRNPQLFANKIWRTYLYGY